jgi:hypothetical protein
MQGRASASKSERNLLAQCNWREAKWRACRPRATASVPGQPRRPARLRIMIVLISTGTAADAATAQAIA